MRADTLTRNEQETVDAIAQLHQAHHQAASPLQRGIDSVTDLIGRPAAIVVLMIAVAGWIAGARLAPGWPDREFVGLELGATLSALLISVLILVTQRREDRLAERREKLTLELALLNEQKSAKIISLLEELRRDAPSIADRWDAESEAMGQPADPAAVLSEIEDRTARHADSSKA